jgi:hypothetical protein
VIQAEHPKVATSSAHHCEIRIVISLPKTSSAAGIVQAVPVASGNEIASVASVTNDSIRKLPPLEEFDWNDAGLHQRFAALERKIGRKSARPDEMARYNTLRNSRRAWIRSRTYLSDYTEEEREKALVQKLKEIRELISPL